MTKEYLQTTIEELETSNEELKSTNEELQSTNEELQSTNEELETSKEELHSTNEELQTVNAELQYKLDELSETNDDLSNLLSSTEIGTIFLDNDLRIKRFTPAAAGIFNLIKGDVNRPISDITSKLIYEDLCKDAEEVLDTLNRKKMEVPTRDGQWHTMTIIPYRTLDNVIDGVVLTFVDITERRHLRRLATVLSDANDAVTVYRLDGRITAWNRKACEIYGYSEEEALKMPVTAIVPEEGRQEAMELLDALKAGKVLNPMVLKRLTKDGRCIDVSVVSTALRNDAGEVFAIATTEQAIEGGS